jgi:NADH:ubiquinone reductase (H+-translocating)
MAVQDRPHRVVVIGSGFGGLFATKHLRRAPVEITLISRTPYHLFQPLLYQVTTGILSEGEIAAPIRDVLRDQANVRVIQGEVHDIDLARRTVSWTLGEVTTSTPYDSLILAAGAGQSYFGNDRFAEFAPGMKSIDDALALRARIFGAFEVAEVETDADRRESWLTFVVVGGGPTGVEMAGQLAELSRRSMKNNFRAIDPATARVVLVEAGEALLAAYGPRLSRRAKRALEKHGVEVQLGARVTDIDAVSVEILNADGRVTRIASRTKVWAAGVSASPLAARIAEGSRATLTRTGQLEVRPDLTVPGHPEVFVVGDVAAIDTVGVAQVAIQGGEFAARQIQRRLEGRPTDERFHYRDKGIIATIARFDAIAKVGPLRLSGFVAWALWLGVHLFYLVGFKNRVSVLMHWAITFAGRARSERTSPAVEFDTDAASRSPATQGRPGGS